MNMTRIVGRIIAGALASAVLVVGAAAPAQAKSDNGSSAGAQTQQVRDTGWGTI